MTMLLNTFVAKNVFQSLSRSVLRGCSPKLTYLKFGASNSVMVHRAPESLNLGVFCSNPIEEFQKYLDSLTSEERDWLLRLNLVSEKLYTCHEGIGTWVYRSQTFYKERSKPKFPSIEKEKYIYRERWATYRLVNKIEDVAKRLIDDNVDDKCHVFYLVDPCEKWVLDFDVQDAHYDQCWLSLLKSSRLPLAQQLRNKLNEVGITPLTFSHSMNSVYCKLLDKCLCLRSWSIEVVHFGPDDIKGVLKNLPTSNTEYECIKILFNLEESEKWQIKDCEKV